jgi:hypothetical protein
MFSKDGHFSLLQSRAEIPKIAANDRAKAAAEEARLPLLRPRPAGRYAIGTQNADCAWKNRSSL